MPFISASRQGPIMDYEPMSLVVGIIIPAHLDSILTPCVSFKAGRLLGYVRNGRFYRFGRFTITIPARDLLLKSSACFSEVVAMPEESPNGVSFATASASS